MSGSLRPSDAKAGGLLDDADVLLKQARFVKYDFAGKSDKPRLCLAIDMIDEASQPHTEYYSAGDLKFFVPTADGKGYDQVADKTALYKSSNAVLFLESLVKAGFPEGRLGQDITVIEGLRIHVTRIAQKQRKFQDGRTTKDDATVLLVSKLLSEVASAGAAAVAGGTDVASKAIATVKAILAANSGRVETARLGTEVFKALMQDAQRNDVLKAITPEFLGAAGRPWIYDGSAGLLIAQ